MALDSIVRNGVALADKLTKPLQVTVRHKSWNSEDIRGKEATSGFVERKAVVIRKVQEVRSNGIMVLTKAQIIFVKPVPITGGANRVEPVDLRDTILLSDGTTGPLVQADPEGVVDPKTNKPYFQEVYLGY